MDGRHAVSAGASRWQRAGKLVATNADGYPPNNILEGPVTEITLTTICMSTAPTSAIETAKRGR